MSAQRSGAAAAAAQDGVIPAAPLRGPTYGRTLRALATVIVLGLLWALLRLALDAGMSAVLWLAPVLLGPYAVLMTAATTIDAEGICQGGLLRRRVRWDEIAHAKVGGTPLARRLNVRTITGRFVSLRAGSPQLLAAFERIAAAFPLR
jgi:hypothetical protein